MPSLKKSMPLLWLAAFILMPASAQAVQPHGRLEGLVSHDLGHLLFSVGIVFMLFHAHRASAELTGKGWAYFKGFLSLALAWNVLTFCGHWLDISLSEEIIERPANSPVVYHVESFLDVFYYFSKLDHLLLLPAMFCLFIALASWTKTRETE